MNLLQAQEQRIAWSESQLLEWSDFKGAPDLNNHFSASTSSGIAFSWSYRSDADGDAYEFEISNFFSPYESWVKPGNKSEHLLQHEQLHFDISELHARELRKLVSQYDISSTIKADFNRFYTQCEQARQQMQRKFDKETQHSRNKEAQAIWEAYITKELAKLADYAI